MNKWSQYNPFPEDPSWDNGELLIIKTNRSFNDPPGVNAYLHDTSDRFESVMAGRVSSQYITGGSGWVLFKVIYFKDQDAAITFKLIFSDADYYTDPIYDPDALRVRLRGQSYHFRPEDHG